MSEFNNLQKLNTRIISKHITLDQANNGTWAPFEGEIVLARVDTQQPDGHGGIVTVPTYLMKVGAKDSEEKLIPIKDLQWTHAPASDVYAWAKQQKLAITTNGSGNVISNIEATATGITITKTDVATTDSVSALQGEVDALEGALAQEVTDRTNADTALDNKITAINENLDGTTEGGIGKRLESVEGVAAGAASKADQNAKNLTDYKAEMVETLKSKVDVGTYNAKMTAIDTETADIRVDFAAADTQLHTTITGEISTAKGEAIVEAGKLDDAQYTKITNEYTSAISTAQSTLQGNIDTLSGTVDANKSANDTAHEGFDDRISELEGIVENVANVMDFVGAGASLPAAESSHKGDVFVINEGDNAGKEYVFDGTTWVEFGFATANENAISKLQSDLADFEAEVARDYATKDELGAETSARTTAISNLDAAYKAADATLKSELEGKISAAEKKAYDDAIAKAGELDAEQTATITTAYEKAVADTKTAIENAQAAVDLAQNTKITALEDEVNGKGDVKGLRTLITEEAARADLAEKANAAAIKVISDDYLKGADKTELENATTTVANNLSTLSGTVSANKLDVDTNFVKVDNGKATVGGVVIIFDCGGVEEA